MQKTAAQISDEVLRGIEKGALSLNLMAAAKDKAMMRGIEALSGKPVLDSARSLPFSRGSFGQTLGEHLTPAQWSVAGDVRKALSRRAPRVENMLSEGHMLPESLERDPQGSTWLREMGRRKTSSQISDEVLQKLSASGKENVISKAMGWLSKGKGAKRPAYVTKEELARSAEEAQKKLRMLGDVPKKVDAPRASSKPLKIQVWPHKAASSIADEVLHQVKMAISGEKALKVFQGTADRAASTLSGKVPGKTPTGVHAKVYGELEKRAPRTAQRAVEQAEKNLVSGGKTAMMQELADKQASMLIAESVFAKLAQGEQMDPSMYEDTPARKRHWPWGAGGALAGGLAGHYLLPSDITKGYRETAKGLEGASQAAQEAYKPYYDPKAIKFQGVPEEIAKQHGVAVRDIGAGGQKVRFNAPANVARDYMKSRAWAESMPRTLGGAALGLGGGLLLSSMLS